MQLPVNLLVLGDGILLSAMRAASASQRVHFEGFVNQSAMPAVLSLGDILALPSSFEPWGLVVNEALAVGLLPVVSDSVGCAPDLVEGLGEVFPTSDIEEFANALDRAVRRLSLPEWRHEAAIRNAEYSISRTAEGFSRAAMAACRHSAGFVPMELGDG